MIYSYISSFVIPLTSQFTSLWNECQQLICIVFCKAKRAHEWFKNAFLKIRERQHWSPDDVAHVLKLCTYSTSINLCIYIYKKYICVYIWTVYILTQALLVALPKAFQVSPGDNSNKVIKQRLTQKTYNESPRFTDSYIWKCSILYSNLRIITHLWQPKCTWYYGDL